MNVTQTSKLVDELPEVDVVITMGCNVDCPWLPCQFREVWDLDDPSNGPDEGFVLTQNIIQDNIRSLKERILNKEIDIK